MTVRELINELLHANMNAEVALAYDERARETDLNIEEKLNAVRTNSTEQVIFLCGRARSGDFEPL